MAEAVPPAHAVRPGLRGQGQGLSRHLEPRQQQDWILKCLQGGRARPLAACGVVETYNGDKYS